MLHKEEYIAGLIIKFLRGEIAEVERQELMEWVSESPENKTTFDRNTTDEKLQEALTWVQQSQIHTWNRLKNEVIRTRVIAFPFRKLIPYAAAVLVILLATVSYLWVFNKKAPSGTAATPATYKNDVLPANGVAILTLSDGKKIILDSTMGIVAQQGSTQISNHSGRLIVAPSDAQSRVVYNSVNTEKGGQYSIVLSDGTIAWLNAASSLTFPNTFAGDHRKVEITGEVYFEVAEEAAKPFIVGIKTPAGRDRGEIEVLGTHFNVNAYDDDAIVRTTLLEGSVKVSKGTGSIIVKPNQQAQINNGEIKVINDPDMEQVMAWKNGLFLMKNADIGSIMRNVKKWYNVEIVYENKQPITQEFIGRISRKESLSKLLNLLELTEAVKFSIEGNKVIITNGRVK